MQDNPPPGAAQDASGTADSHGAGAGRPGLLGKLVKNGTLLRAVAGTGGLGLAEKGLALASAILLARLLGAESYGYYSFAVMLASLLAVPFQRGIPQFLTRAVARTETREDWSGLAGLRRWAVRVTPIAAVGVAVGLGSGLLLLAPGIAALDRLSFAIALALVPFTAMLAARAGLLRGLGRAVQAMWPRTVLKRCLFLLAVIGLTVAGVELQAPIVVLAQLAASAIALTAAAVMLRRYWPARAREAAARPQTRRWMRESVPFLLIAVTTAAAQKGDILLAGILLSASDVGVYRIVTQGGILIAMPLAALNPVIGPRVARLYIAEDIPALQRLLTGSSAVMAAFAGIGLLVFVFAGDWLLAAIFGAEFAAGHVPLVIYGIGQLLHVAAGSVGVFLTMSGYEKLMLRAMIVSAAVNLAATLALIPPFGLAGAAGASALSIVALNAMMALAVYRRLGIVAGPLPIRRPRAR